MVELPVRVVRFTLLVTEWVTLNEAATVPAMSGPDILAGVYRTCTEQEAFTANVPDPVPQVLLTKLKPVPDTLALRLDAGAVPVFL